MSNDSDKSLRDKAQGVIFGGAAGDALGYAVEFMDLTEIHDSYGEHGIREYELDANHTALFSDDTQMTLFTAEGLLSATLGHEKPDLGAIISSLKASYSAWLATQTDFQLPLPTSWLTHLRALWARRAPGNTCISSLQALRQGKDVANDSKGCGGVMRIAPVAVWAAARDDMDDVMVARIAAEAAKITHHNVQSTCASALTALIIYKCMLSGNTDSALFRSIVESSLPVALMLASDPKEKEYFRSIIEKSLRLAESEVSDIEAIRRLGEGWVAEETIAIAIFCVMRHIDDFGAALESSVNHDGDSDSTGAVTGNIAGALTGYAGIPEKFKRNLQLADVLLSVADDLCGASPGRQMIKRYKEHKICGVAEEEKFISGMKFTDENIKELGEDEVFVFGSNKAGHHAGGAARIAARKFGAVWGQGVGMQGQSYAIPTMQGGVETIKPYVDDFIEFASDCDQNPFLVTRIGCGIAGFTDAEIAPLFREALKLYNVRLPESFVRILLDE
ncbi:MAG: ADP-ribosylglycohydrolase family protein [Muribaculaceae bacterium]|nr:ADP-ribosylglycohydrolase family protein [Muribaculaceae bacterium]